MQQMQNKVKSYNQETSELSTISCIIKNGAEIVFSSDVHLSETDFKDKFLGRCFFAIKTLAESGFCI